MNFEESEIADALGGLFDIRTRRARPSANLTWPFLQWERHESDCTHHPSYRLHSPHIAAKGLPGNAGRPITTEATSTGTRHVVTKKLWTTPSFGHCRSASGLYWFDDTGRGSVRVPASWRIPSRDAEEWKPIETRNPYAVAKDGFNTAKFQAGDHGRAAGGVQAPPAFSVGVQKWTVK
jgi:hypothetical protein